MTPRERKLYNLANLLLAVLVKKESLESRKNLEQMAGALSTNARSKANSVLLKEENNFRNYLKQQNVPGDDKLASYLDWISGELGSTYAVRDLHKRVSIDPALLPGVSACRERLGLTALEEGESADSGFYDIHINRWWNKSVANVELKDKRDDGKLENYLLYQTFSAARLWDEVTASEHYDLPGLCRAGLESILRSSSFAEIVKTKGIFFELGTGSPTKTSLILNRLKATQLRHHFVWVDASTPMLEHNVSKIETKKYAPLQFSVVSTDFEEIKELLEFLGTRWATEDFYEVRKCYFVLGFTLSNLDEARFIRAYASACNTGDVLVFPMQFIPPSYASTDTWADIANSDYGRELINAYNSPEGLKLVREGLSQIKGQTRLVTAQAQPIRPIGGIPSDDCIGRSVMIRYMADFEHLDMGDRKVRKKLEIIKASRFFESDFLCFLNRHGFAIRQEIAVGENIKTFLVEFVGKNISDPNNGEI